MSDYASLLSIARAIAVEAAHLARQRRNDGVDVAASKSSPEDVVTAADREVEQLIRLRLTQARPHDGFLGEESGATGGSSGLTWVVDPIDGTVNYLYGIPAYAVSIAVVEGAPDPNTWKSLAGVVVNAASGEVFTARRGGGAQRDGVTLRACAPASLPLALVGTGFGYDAGRRRRQGAVVQELLGAVRDIRRIGSAALDLCSVASGRLNAYFERGLNPWDFAAGALIAQEAGARVEGLAGRAASAELLIAAPEPLFTELATLLRELRADTV
ncbi:inositol monophosphatase family protein [Rathayibacter toxicus]|uniref:Inositol-1-monophosphatase n=1 Tax=Rathayibacter toxicus TaxID=145458 RepID=A0A2S5Y5C5_9MICO|nr:inositol monophosphatase family protein [Rathayibacter toxicus]PPH21794.1 inositol monophosphatase [Rathayibacter toxicus]PPH56223.1 inositol monophosphatase [Rathayibacter toxicus]PPH58319.1 inositol monophosphatase [Rathayibacter toxicus]PPH86066.1 inositol monophosphatase [Rathayibacter toxicus]PPI13950.1 inositol monophosphatase [Rathayibacter toxicus]